MGKTKELALQLTEQMTYDPTFSKRQAIEQGQELAQQIKDNGNVSVEDATSKLVRMTTVFNEAFKQLKDEIQEDISINGVNFKFVEGSPTYDFESDATWSHLYSKIDKLKTDLKYREKQLIKASKSEKTIVDDEGFEVEPVPVRGYKKSYVRITF